MTKKHKLIWVDIHKNRDEITPTYYFDFDKLNELGFPDGDMFDFMEEMKLFAEKEIKERKDEWGRLQIIRLNVDEIKRKTIASYQLGTMMLYTNIFGPKEILETNIDNKGYFMLDAYCVMPNCDCVEVALNFFEKGNCKDEHKQGTLTPDFSFVYDYITKESKEPEGTTNEGAERIVKGFTDEKNESFKKRHEELKEEVRPAVLKKMEKKGLIRLPGQPKEKLGRNEPCHCGSGKKYKKCCLDKDIKQYGSAIRI